MASGTTFILAQILSVFAWLFLLYSYYKDNIQKLLRIQIISAILDTVSYILLGADAGLLICAFELIKAILYYKTDKDNLIFLFTLPIYILIAWYSCNNEGLIALLPIAGSIIDGFALTRNKTIATIGSIIATILWIIYDIFMYAYSAAATDTILIASNLFVLALGYSRILHIDKLHIVRCRYLSRRICANVIALDREAYSEEYLWSFDQHKNIFDINSNVFLLIRDKKKTIGYINYIVISEEKYEQLKRARSFYGTIAPSDIAPLRKRRKNYVFIESINVRKDYESQKMTKLVLHRLLIDLRNKNKQGFNISGIISVAVSDFEKTLFQNANFTHIKNYNGNEEVYELDNEAIKNLLRPKHHSVK